LSRESAANKRKQSARKGTAHLQFYLSFSSPRKSPQANS
jgi:hypothetical protein